MECTGEVYDSGKMYYSKFHVNGRIFANSSDIDY